MVAAAGAAVGGTVSDGPEAFSEYAGTGTMAAGLLPVIPGSASFKTGMLANVLVKTGCDTAGAGVPWGAGCAAVVFSLVGDGGGEAGSSVSSGSTGAE